jgi:RNA polymerase sigma-70 factor (ECF subfamily)
MDERDVHKWLFHAAYCNAISVLRRRSLITWESLTRHDDADLSDSVRGDGFEERIVESAALRAALATLEPADRSYLRLSTYEGFSTAEIAQILEIAPAAARKRLSRAMHRLRAAYLAQEADVTKQEAP